MEIANTLTSTTIGIKSIQDSMKEVSNTKSLDAIVVEDLKKIQEKLENEVKTSEKINDLTGKGSLLNILA
jgi:hypothetical protein